MGTGGNILESANLSVIDCVLQRVTPSKMQTAEWGVAALKVSFKRLAVNLPADAYKRYRIIACCAHLMNFRTRTVGFEQIRSVYAVAGSVTQPWLNACEQEFLLN